MSAWQQTLELLKKAGLSRGTIQAMYGKRRRIWRGKGSPANQYPRGHRAKRKRLQKIQKESRRRNRA
jgi:hypothetical protein